MATPKKQTITKHKQTNSKIGSVQPAVSSTSGGGQSFDIIPRSRVQPSVTARPVLTPTSPEQADNTLQTSSQAASSKLSHSPLRFGATDESGMPPTAPEVSSSNSLLDQVASLAALVAKPRAPKPEPADTAETDDRTDASQPAAPEKTVDSVEAAPSIEQHQVSTEPSEEADLKAVAEASAALDAQHPKLDPVPVAPAEAAVTGPATVSPAPSPPTARPATPSTVDVTPPAPTASDPSNAETDNSDNSLDQALKEDDSKPIEHSQALKDELKGMDADGDEPVHHELYGGKPVIVIHKAHGSTSTVGWVLWFIACLLVALLTVDVLLDAGVIVTDYNVPHSHLLQ